MQGSSETFSWISVVEKLVASLLFAGVSGVCTYVASRLLRRPMSGRVARRAQIEEARWSAYLRQSPLAVAIAWVLVVLTFALGAVCLTFGLRPGWVWYAGYGLVLLCLLSLDSYREFYASGLVVKEVGYQAIHELLGVLHNRVVQITSRDDMLAGFYRVVRCNIMLHDPSSGMLGMKHWLHFDHEEGEDVDKGRVLAAHKGVAGAAFAAHREMVGIFAEIDRPTEGVDEWGFTAEDWEGTRSDLRWVWSVPLMSSKPDEDPLGVLNVDSNAEISWETHELVGAVAVGMAEVLRVICQNVERA